MIANSVKFRGYKCFQDEFSGFEEIKPINVIIGRNNSGKSHLLKLVEQLCMRGFAVDGVEYSCRGRFESAGLKREFPHNHSGGTLQGDFWDDHGCHFIDKQVSWNVDKRGNANDLKFEKGFDFESPYGPSSTEVRIEFLKKVLRNSEHTLSGRKFRRLLADRDIAAERAAGGLNLSQSGRGATNIVRAYIHLENRDRNVIQKELLAGLNEIFGPDGQFSEITTQQISQDEPDKPPTWEVYLGEGNKEIIALSESGSGLKTVFLVLLNLIVVRVYPLDIR